MNQLRHSARNLCLIADAFSFNANTSYDEREREVWDKASHWLMDVMEVLERVACELEKGRMG